MKERYCRFFEWCDPVYCDIDKHALVHNNELQNTQTTVEGIECANEDNEDKIIELQSKLFQLQGEIVSKDMEIHELKQKLLQLKPKASSNGCYKYLLVVVLVFTFFCYYQFENI